ncbi:dUTP diphosphatase [Alicyclobacillus fodiniaquatilis]|jgi:dimeric dUTPase (all-alpha-NTP-PPase superfamily)|uniref:dUTP diphosphatase n=1 Tax=Alicyclobacillus fodiniaquatilis TaxID=1661150 RepID=A0ABW4JRJ2_9BACL
MKMDSLFDVQKALEPQAVMASGHESQSLLPKKILALQIELGGLANLWHHHGLHVWKHNQGSPEQTTYPLLQTDVPLSSATNPLLESYLNCLHLILSIGLDLGCDFHISDYIPIRDPSNDVGAQFRTLFRRIAQVDMDRWHGGKYYRMFCSFIGLGEMLDLTWSEIQQHYLETTKTSGRHSVGL